MFLSVTPFGKTVLPYCGWENHSRQLASLDALKMKGNDLQDCFKSWGEGTCEFWEMKPGRHQTDIFENRAKERPDFSTNLVKLTRNLWEGGKVEQFSGFSEEKEDVSFDASWRTGVSHTALMRRKKHPDLCVEDVISASTVLSCRERSVVSLQILAWLEEEAHLELEV